MWAPTKSDEARRRGERGSLRQRETEKAERGGRGSVAAATGDVTATGASAPALAEPRRARSRPCCALAVPATRTARPGQASSLRQWLPRPFHPFSPLLPGGEGARLGLARCRHAVLERGRTGGAVRWLRYGCAAVRLHSAASAATSRASRKYAQTYITINRCQSSIIPHV